ncbi:MAG: hypothetical protein LBS88_12905 [Tannerellaceae bacterium]|jgi:hypothetical protein|nr:hypothetical protein [Tannerellaceae bacterium]
MDKLKDFIGKNREAFDEDLLPEGHFGRFRKKLERKKKIRRLSLWSISIAAGIGLCFFLKIQSERKDTHQQPALFTCEAEEEIEELRLYYKMQMYEVEAQIKDLCAGRETPGSIELMKETEQVIQTTYDFEAMILPSLPCSDAGVFAMNQHYSNSLRSLNFMLTQMEHIVNINYHN